MTQIDFYTHVEDKNQVTCSLAAKVIQQGLRMTILTADEAATGQLDRLLWTHAALSFLPHCRSGDALAGVTPLVVDHAPDPLDHDDVLLNLTPDRPPFFSRFKRLIEIVSLDEQDRAAARERFRFYRDRGYDIRSHDLSKQR